MATVPSSKAVLTEEDKGLWTVPNAITTIRGTVAIFFILPLLFEALATPAKAPAWLVIYSIVILFDFVDGFVARRYSMRSKFGKMLDPAVDKAVMFTSFFYLYRAISPRIGVWWLLAVSGILLFRFAEDVFSTSLYIQDWLKGCVKGANSHGKRKVGADFFAFVGGYFLLLQAGPDGSTNASAMALCLGCGVASCLAWTSLHQKLTER